MHRRQDHSPPVSEASNKFLDAADQGNKNAPLTEAVEGFIYWNVLKQRRRLRATFLPSWLTITVLLGFLLMTSVCWHGRKKGMNLGALPRRLAGSDEHESGSPQSPASPELSALCAELGDWAPVESEPGVPRESPETVREFLEAIEHDGEEQPPSVSASPPPGVLGEAYGAGGDGSDAPKRRAPSSSGSDEEDAPGPSSKVAKYAHPPQPPQPPERDTGEPAAAGGKAPTQPPRSRAGKFPLLFAALTGGTEGLSATRGTDGASTPAAAAAGMLRVSLPRGTRPRESPVLRSLLTADPAAPSTSSAAQAEALVQEGAPASAPGMRPSPLPTLQEGVRPRTWDTSYVFYISHTPRYYKHLLMVRELLCLPSLNSNQMENLQGAVESLANFAVFKMNERSDPKRPHELVEHWGLRFLIISALYSAAQVVGGGAPPWWNGMAAAITSGSGQEMAESSDPEVQARLEFASRLAAAVRSYADYEDPGDREVRSLKRTLFWGSESTYYFREERWGPWKSDSA